VTSTPDGPSPAEPSDGAPPVAPSPAATPPGTPDDAAPAEARSAAAGHPFLHGPPPAEPPAFHRRPLARVWLLVGPLLVLSVVALVTSAFVDVDYILLAPGSATPVQPLVEVEDGKVFRTQGELMYTTVGVGQPSAIEAVYGWLHDDIDLFPRADINGDKSNEETRRESLQMMDTSKLVATKVALEKLGYTVDVSGTGVTVLSVANGLPVEGKLDPGDVITALDGDPARLDDDLRRLIEEREPGDVVTLQVERAGTGRTQDVDVELAPRPQDPTVPFIGITIETRDLEFDFPVDVRIDSGKVGGPSAGLAFTLAILDRLTPGSLTGGERVAITGAINPDGSVGPVGGVAQKTVAAIDADATVFLVPGDEFDIATRVAGDDLDVIQVDTLDDALDALADRGGNALDLGTPGKPGD
jgi:PDZ domain-containing protein